MNIYDTWHPLFLSISYGSSMKRWVDQEERIEISTKPIINNHIKCIIGDFPKEVRIGLDEELNLHVS